MATMIDSKFRHQKLQFFATAPKGISELLAAELQNLGAEVLATKLAGVVFRGTLKEAYKACLWSRLANRILLPLAQFSAPDQVRLYQGIQRINWSEHFSIHHTFAVDFSSLQSEISHTQFGAQKVKDAIVDQFRATFGERPSVEKDQPHIRINVYLFENEATVYLDLSGDSLHKRGYRLQSGAAPLKENLAAAILIRAGWPMIAEQGGALVDLMCGVGTLPIEAALIAANIAPGLLRTYFGFLHWKHHDAVLWAQLSEEARQGQKPIPPIIGYDANPEAIKQGLLHVSQAHLAGKIHLEKKELAAVTLTQQMQKHPGLVILNPPYGERMGDIQQLAYLYQHIGEKFKTVFWGWQGAVFTGNPDLGKRMGLRARKTYALFNGALPCKLLLFSHEQDYLVKSAPKPLPSEDIKEYSSSKHQKHFEKTSEKIISSELIDAVNMFANRLQKNIKHLQRWAQRENIYCYRIYDADLPEYAFAIDRYEEWIHVQEYAAPKTVDSDKATARLDAVMQVLPNLLNVPPSNIFYKVKHKQKRQQQYQKLNELQQFLTVRENGARFLINLQDYLDTGIFLDQRITRCSIKQMASGKHFLNLFAYTGVATVCAALGNAASTTTVDLSNTYLQWAKKNLALNGFSEQKHQFIQADCLAWIKEEKKQYDLIYVEPPTFSRSKKMEGIFDVQRDHLDLLLALRKNLRSQGRIIFATNKHRFKLDNKLLQAYQIEDWSKKTLPLDFSRSAASHHCWSLQRNNFSE